MVSMVIVNSEQCVVRDNKHHVVIEVTHTTHSRQTPKHKGACCVTCVLAGLRAHYTTPATPQTKKTRRQKNEESREQRVVLDGGGARLADAATRHHLTPTQTQTKERKREKRGEQNKHKRTPTIQKTSTRQSTSNGHHTLPSMRSKTPIPQ